MDSELIVAPGYHIDGLLSQSDNVATWSSGLRQRIRQVQRTFHDTGHTDQQATQDKNVSRSPVAFIRQLALVGRVFFDRGDVVSWLERIATRQAARKTLKFLAYMNSVDIEEFAKLYPDKLDRHLRRGKYSRVICQKLIGSQRASRDNCEFLLPMVTKQPAALSDDTLCSAPEQIILVPMPSLSSALHSFCSVQY